MTGFVTIVRHVFFKKKQLKRETLKDFYRKLRELAENYGFENKVEIIVRAVFIANLTLFRDAKIGTSKKMEPRNALKLAITIKLSMRNQHNSQVHKSRRVGGIQLFSLGQYLEQLPRTARIVC